MKIFLVRPSFFFLCVRIKNIIEIVKKRIKKQIKIFGLVNFVSRYEKKIGRNDEISVINK